MRRDVTVCIPTIPPRMQLLTRAVASVMAQTQPATALAIAPDINHYGAAHTRQRALDMATTEWVAFLDDDDEFLHEHLARLLDCAETHSADYVYSWFHVVGGVDPFPAHHFLNPFNPSDPIQTTITVLVKTDLAQQVGFHMKHLERPLVQGQVWGEDYSFTLDCLNAGANIVHLPERTWLWHHDSGNTSGRGDRW